MLSNILIAAVAIGGIFLGGFQIGKMTATASIEKQATLVTQEVEDTTRRLSFELSGTVNDLIEQERELTRTEEYAIGQIYTDSCAIDADRLRAVGKIR